MVIRTNGESRARAVGALVGLAAGDRNGGPVEMAVRLAESLADHRGFDANDVLDRYLDWHRDGGFDTGPVTGRVLTLIDAGSEPASAVRQVDAEFDGRTAGCNPAHRVTPLALSSHVPDDSLADAARRETSLTHAHPLAGETAAAVAVLVRSLVRGRPLGEAIAQAARGRARPVLDALLAPAARSAGGFAPETLGAAVHFLEVGSGFADALHRSLVFAGPANYSPVLVGALAGARWGVSAIDHADLSHVTDLGRVRRAAEKLVGT